MGVLATGNITLTSINDGCSVVLSKSSCIVNASLDGKQPDLSEAFTEVSLMRGSEQIHISSANITVSAPDGVVYVITTVSDTTQKVAVTSIPASLKSCTVSIKVTHPIYSTTVMFSITVVRETSMLDWILDWESNKTTIGSTYILTPKIYAGSVTQGENGTISVSGVYIGPDETNGAGVYGYKDGIEIFHLNSKGGKIAGWDIQPQYIQTSDGRFQLLSEGTIKTMQEDGTVVWALYKSGLASFAKGNVVMRPDGSASFKGSITASSGKLANWVIKENYIHSNNLLIRSTTPLIGVSPYAGNIDDKAGTYLEDVIKVSGGVAMYYESNTSYGLVGYEAIMNNNSPQLVFSLGKTNKIAGWIFDTDSLYLGNKVNVLGKTTLNPGDLTLGTKGLRGFGWRIDTNGDFSFADNKFSYNKNLNLATIAGWKIDSDSLYIGDKVNVAGMKTSKPGEITIGSTGIRGNAWRLEANGDFDFADGKFSYSKDKDTAKIAGWQILNNNISNGYITIVADSNSSGIYFSLKDLSGQSVEAIETAISLSSGISIAANKSKTYLSGYYNGKCSFKIGSDGNIIGGWNFDHESIWIGSSTVDDNGFITAGGTAALKLDKYAIHGTKWVLNADGSGKLANGAISWDTAGNVQFAEDAKVNWGPLSNTLTHFDKDGVYTGKIVATSGQIGGFTIQGSSLTGESDGAKMSLEPGCHIYVREDASSGLTQKGGFGNGAIPAVAGVDAVFGAVVDYTDIYPENIIGMYLSVTGKSYDDSPQFGPHALYISSGHICGFRLRMRRVSKDTTLSLMDSIILCAGQDPNTHKSISITLRFPTGCEDGQIYIMRKINSGGGDTGRVYYTCSGSDRLAPPQFDMGDTLLTSGQTSKDASITSGNASICVYDATNKIWWCNGFHWR